MDCKQTDEMLDDLLDGALTDAEAGSLNAHAATCVACGELIERERALRQRLRRYGDLTMPTPDTTFFDDALVTAARSGTARQRNRWLLTGFGGAIAAGLALWIVAGVLLQAPQIDTPAVPAVTMALEEPRTVNLVFSSAEALDNAVLAVSLPHGVEIEGFAGQREITWETSLEEGKNILPLTLIATTSQGGELLATLTHGGDDKRFRVLVTVI